MRRARSGTPNIDNLPPNLIRGRSATPDVTNANAARRTIDASFRAIHAAQRDWDVDHLVSSAVYAVLNAQAAEWAAGGLFLVLGHPTHCVPGTAAVVINGVRKAGSTGSVVSHARSVSPTLNQGVKAVAGTRVGRGTGAVVRAGQAISQAALAACALPMRYLHPGAAVAPVMRRLPMKVSVPGPRAVLKTPLAAVGLARITEQNREKVAVYPLQVVLGPWLDARLRELNAVGGGGLPGARAVFEWLAEAPRAVQEGVMKLLTPVRGNGIVRGVLMYLAGRASPRQLQALQAVMEHYADLAAQGRLPRRAHFRTLPGLRKTIESLNLSRIDKLNLRRRPAATPTRFTSAVRSNLRRSPSVVSTPSPRARAPRPSPFQSRSFGRRRPQ